MYVYTLCIYIYICIDTHISVYVMCVCIYIHLVECPCFSKAVYGLFQHFGTWDAAAVSM